MLNNSTQKCLTKVSRPANQPLIFILISPSGGGKTTIKKQLKKYLRNFFFSVSATTRPKRKGERNRSDYLFLTTEEFQRQKARNEFLETVHRYGNDYGTPKKPLLSALASGRHCLLCLEPIGAKRIKQLFPNQTRTIFIKPPSQKELARRLAHRSSREREKRMAEDKNLFGRISADYTVLNKNLPSAIRQIISIIRKELKR